MNPDYEKQLEARVQRELEALGELPAPPALANRILHTIEQRAAAPWHRQSWQAWPLVLRAASLVLLLAAFSGLCLGGWQLAANGTAPESFGEWFANAAALWRTLGVLGDTVTALFNQFGNGFIGIAAAIIFSACVLCLGLGTICVRLALRPTPEGIKS